MSTSKFSRSRLFPSCFRHSPTVYVCGLLGTYSIYDKPQEHEDIWIAIDFIATRQLLGARDDTSTWFCGTPFRKNRGFLLEDPAGDRIVFDPPPFEKVLQVKPKLLAIEFLSAVSKASSKLSSGDTLVLVLVGYGDKKNHSFVIGDHDRSVYFELEKEELEVSVRGTKGKILVINTACYSSGWTSTYWTLLAAAEPDQHAPSIVVSSSGKCRGGFFTNALLAEYADEFNIQPPYPGSMDANGRRAQQRKHDFGPDKLIHPSPRLPPCSLQDVIDRIHRFRDDSGRMYTSADTTFHLCREGPHRLPFTCVPPSPAVDHASIYSTANRAAISPAQDVSAQTHRKLSEREEAELRALAADLLHFMPITIPSEIPTILRCWRIINGVRHNHEPLNDVSRSKLFSDLKHRVYQRELALDIANNLGWAEAVRELGGPGGKQTQMDDMVALRREAEASGCLVSILTIPVTPYTKWAGAAGWLARVWRHQDVPSYLRTSGLWLLSSVQISEMSVGRMNPLYILCPIDLNQTSTDAKKYFVH